MANHGTPVNPERASQELIQLLRGTWLFREVDEAALQSLAEALTRREVPAHTALIRRGEQDGNLYVIQSGELEILLPGEDGRETRVACHGPGDCVGEMGLLTGAVRSASVRALVDCRLWQLSREDFRRVAAQVPNLHETVAAAYTQRVHRAQVRAAVYEGPEFQGLGADLRRELEQAMEPIFLRSGQALVRLGDPADALYVVLSGRLRAVRQAPSGEEQLLNEIGSGQVVGEMGLLTGEPRSATLVAVRGTLVGRLTAPAYFGLVQRFPQEMTRFSLSRAIGQWRDGPDAAGSRARTKGSFSWSTLAIVSLGDEPPVRAFADGLTAEIGRFGSAQHIDAARTDRELGEAGIAQALPGSAADSRFSLWGRELESSYDYLLFSCHHGREGHVADHPTGDQIWEMRCLQQADAVLYLAWADQAPPAHPFLGHGERQCALVLLHPPDRETPTGSQAWLQALAPTVLYHVRWPGDPATGDENPHTATDMRRLARLLTGNGVGLVLSGGGARGLAHVGAIRALQEAQIPIDLIGGTSMGAIVGGLLAIGHDARAMEAMVARFLNGRLNLVDFTLPITSLFAGKKLTSLMEQLYGDRDIADAWLPFFCVTTDLTRAAQAILRAGPMWKYVRASSSLPVAFPPQVDREHLLIDGCIMNSFPADVMANTPGCGTVIGVDVCAEVDMNDKNRYGNSLSGWDIIRSRLTPWRKPVVAPGLIDILERVTELTSVERSPIQRSLTHLYIRPPVKGYGAQEFEKYRAIIEAGYHAAVPRIAEWMATPRANRLLAAERPQSRE